MSDARVRVADPLDRVVSDEQRAEWARLLAQPEAAERGARISLLVFELGGETLAIEPSIVRDVVLPRTIRALPHRRSSNVLGVVNAWGTLAVCIDLAALLGVAPSRAGERDTRERWMPRLLVLQRAGQPIACPVPHVHGTAEVGPHAIDEASNDVAAAGIARGVFRWRQRTVACLDADRLFAAIERSLA